MKQTLFFSSLLLSALSFVSVAIADTQLSDHEAAFLKQHWPNSIPLQGKPPASHSKLEASLNPRSCGACHVRQYRDWKTSFHAKAMGPGLLGQLVEMVDSDPASARMCWSCHTPLAEQQDKLFTAEGWKTNPAFDQKLQHQGLICAACHVRNHQRFGPPRKGRPDQTGKISGKLPHNGFTAETAFTKSAFCKGCHQFNEGDYALNGKLIENTYNEWQESDYPEKGVQCQGCHMPDRRHLWRGIHDEEMTKQGVTINLETNQKHYRQGETVEATIRIINSGVGHYFPTYLTPKIEVNAYLVDAQGEMDQTSFQQAMIGREVTLDMSQELYDTRIPPGETLAIKYDHVLLKDQMQLRVEATVYPDHFYTRFYESMLSNGSAGRGTKLIEQALEESRNSSFTLFEKTLPLTKNTAALRLKPLNPSQPSSNPENPNSHEPDWNTEHIQWLDYESGLQQAKQTGKPIMLIFFAEWCATCHAYKHIFADARVVEQAKALIMVRANVDLLPKVAGRYANDGEYVPRIYALNSKGEQITEPFDSRVYPKHFVRVNATEEFLALMQNVTR